MKIFLLLLLIITFPAMHVFAQDARIVDSLLKLTDQPLPDTGKMNVYNKLGNYYMDNNAGKAIEYLEKAKEIAIRNKLELKAANNFYSIGFCYLLQADFEKSLYNYQQSVPYYEKLKDSFRLSNAMMSIGNVYFQNNNKGKTNEYYDKAEALIIAMKDSAQLSSLYNSRGINYDQAGSFDTALTYLQKGYSIAKQMHDLDFVANSLCNIGVTYKHLQRTDEALRCFDTVRLYYQTHDVPKDQLAALYNNIAATNAQAGKYKQALQSFSTSIGLAKEAGAPTIEMENYRNISDMYGDMKNFEQQSVYLKKYYNIKDSLFTSGNKNRLTELEANYQVEKKNSEIAKKDAEVVQQKNQRNISISIALGVLCLLAGVSFFYSRIRSKNVLLEQKNAQINRQKNELQTLNQVKDKLFSIISHDLRNPLITLRSYLALADNDQVTPGKKLQFKLQTMHAVLQTNDMLDNLLAWANVQIRNTEVRIIPVSLPDLVEDICSAARPQASAKQINIQQELAVPAVPGDYNILSIALRNLVTNAIKFSNQDASIGIRSYRQEDKVYLSVQDHGVGMNKEQVDAILTGQQESTRGTGNEKGSGLGLFLVIELLRKIHAQLLIESEPGKGSRFMIVLPSF